MNTPKANRSNPFNESFCIQLEYLLGQAFGNSSREDIKGFWCDGVSWESVPEIMLTRKSINDTKQLVTKAWIGKEGQDEYELTLRFGPYALRRYAKGTDMVDCIPSPESMDWIDIDPDRKRIEISLK